MSDLRIKCTKFDCRLGLYPSSWGSTPAPAVGAYSVPLGFLTQLAVFYGPSSRVGAEKKWEIRKERERESIGKVGER